MKTNKFLEKFFRLKNEISEAEDKLGSMDWRDEVYNSIVVKPDLFRSFGFTVFANNPTGSLTIKTARSLAKYLLEATDGLDEHDGCVLDELIKRKLK